MRLLRGPERHDGSGVPQNNCARALCRCHILPCRLQASISVEDILTLKKERRAVILAHNYQVKEIQELADFVGDSLGPCLQGSGDERRSHRFLRSSFHAETAKIVNPTKTVVLPDLNAGCSLSDSCPPEKLAAFLEQHREKKYYVIAYINCSAGVKALSDVICTSGNAVKIVQSAPKDRNILFVPASKPRLMGDGADWPANGALAGNCYVHVEFTRQSIERIRVSHPAAPVVAHPECTYAVRILADEVCSTEKMISYCKSSPARSFIIVPSQACCTGCAARFPERSLSQDRRSLRMSRTADI
jgi:quinolinate synthase